MIAAILLCAALNINPAFDAAPDSLPGWTLLGPARPVRDADGRQYVLADEGGVRSDLFPVEGGTQIEVSLKASGPRFLRSRKPVWTAVSFFATPEEAKAKGAQWKFARPKLEIATSGVSERSETYPVPPDARWCRLTVRGGSVYRCEAKPVKK